VYLFIDNGTEARLFNADGILYCTNTATYNCQDFYQVQELITSWNCGSSSTGGNTGGSSTGSGNTGGSTGHTGGNNTQSTPAIFTSYPWLTQHVNPSNCFTDRVIVFVNGIYKYIQVETPNGDVLYTESGQVYCTGGPGYHCPTLYGFTQIETSWSCGASLEEEAATSRDNDFGVELALPAKQMNFEVYPNPTVGPFTVELPSTIQGEAQIRIVDLQGRILYQQELSSDHIGPIAIDLSDKNTGMYLVQWITNEQVQSQRIIVE